MKCAKEFREHFGNFHDDEATARHIDATTNLPALTAVALAAQGVIDAYDRAHPISRTVSELKHALSKL